MKLTKLKKTWFVLKDIWHLLLPYFTTRDKGSITIPFLGSYRVSERLLGLFLLVSIIAIEFLQVGITVRLSYFNRDFFNAIQEYDKAAFWQLLLSIFLFWVVVYVIAAILQYVLSAYLNIRWRRWLTQYMIDFWLKKETFYKMQLLKISPDNPDQRIANDIEAFVSTTLSLGVSFLSTVSTLISFSIVLWTLSANFPIPGTSIYFPGFLVWFCLFYTGIATYITHLIGRSLGQLNFQQQRYEADFRFSLARLREYNEPVALMQGYDFEKNALKNRFLHVINNFLSIVSITKRLISFRAAYAQLSVVIPYMVMAPYYFAKLIPLGVMSQTAGAFNSVIDSMSFFSSVYEQLAQYKSVVDRLMGFEKALKESESINTNTLPNFSHTYEVGTSSIDLEDVRIFLPNQKVLLFIPQLSISKGESVLITGPSGSGKTTLFRTLMGIWPFTQGTLHIPDPNTMMSIPQKPYFPLGTLRACLTYPYSSADWADDEPLKKILRTVGLSSLEEQLDTSPPQHAWSLCLSGGEQQRLALARALLQKPGWIFLDESTSAVDETMEINLYTLLRTQLPGTSLISISHRSSLKDQHQRVLTVIPETEGFTLRDSSIQGENRV